MKKVLIIILTLITILIPGHIRIFLGWAASFMIDVIIYSLLGYYYTKSKSYTSWYPVFLIAATLVFPINTLIGGRDYWYPYLVPLYLIIALISFFSGYLWSKNIKRLSIILIIFALSSACLVGKYSLNILSVNFVNPAEYRPVIGVKPLLKFYDIDGRMIDNNTLRGKIVIIDFWFIQCSVCQDKLSSFAYLSKLYSNNKNVIFLSVFNNKINSVNSVKEFMKLERLPMNGLSYDKDGEFQKKYNVGQSGYPVELLINKKGVLTKVVTSFIGHELYIKESTETINNLLKE